MKKIFALLLAVGVFATTSFAQTKPAAKTPAPVKKEAVKTTQKPKVATTTTAPTKKDGTPDKRYKENKATAKPTGPTKKDGTPDKRYKENKKG